MIDLLGAELAVAIYLISLPAAIVGLILGINGQKQAKAAGQKNGIAITGIILSAIGLGLVVLVTFIAILILAFDLLESSAVYY